MSKVAGRTFVASDAKNNFGALIDAAQREPVAIKRNGRPVAYIISPKEMERIEDWYLGARAMEVIKKGKWLGVEESERYIKSVLKDA